jgi:hypothetical protein
MELIVLFVAVIFSFATSLGVGSSTIAIANFFVAIADGRIEPDERKMMGVVYIILRVAMVALFITLSILTAYNTYHLGAAAFTPLLFAQWTVLAVLYGNAILMTLRIMPSTFGPAIQAGSWYTLGTMAALLPLGMATFTYGQFVLGYIVMIVMATGLVNGLMAVLKSAKEKREAAAATQQPAEQ